MSLRSRHILLAAAALAAALSSEAGAADYSTAASYNSGYGMYAGQENQAINPNLRDANGNLTIVNGQFTSSSFSSQTGVQSMGTISSSSLSSYGTSNTTTAIGNALNVVVVGSHNTTIVNSNQTNTGNITATTNGSTAQ